MSLEVAWCDPEDVGTCLKVSLRWDGTVGHSRGLNGAIRCLCSVVRHENTGLLTLCTCGCRGDFFLQNTFIFSFFCSLALETKCITHDTALGPFPVRAVRFRGL